MRNETLHYSCYPRDIITKYGKGIVMATVAQRYVIRRLAAAYFERCCVREHVVKRARKCHGHFLKKPEKVIHTVHGLAATRRVYTHTRVHLHIC